MAVLEALYKRGLMGWGRRHQGDIETAVKSTGLCPSQVKLCLNCHIIRIASNTNASLQTKNWIRRRNMKRHAGEEADQGMLHNKRVMPHTLAAVLKGRVTCKKFIYLLFFEPWNE